MKKGKQAPAPYTSPLRVRLARQAAGLGLHQASKKADLSWALLAHWEREAALPWPQILERLAEAYGTTAAWLTGACAPGTEGLWKMARQRWAAGELSAEFEKDLLRRDPPGGGRAASDGLPAAVQACPGGTTEGGLDA